MALAFGAGEGYRGWAVGGGDVTERCTKVM